MLEFKWISLNVFPTTDTVSSYLITVKERGQRELEIEFNKLRGVSLRASPGSNSFTPKEIIPLLHHGDSYTSFPILWYQVVGEAQEEFLSV